MKLLFSHMGGMFVTDDRFTVLEKIPFEGLADYENRTELKNTLLKKDVREATVEHYKKFFGQLRGSLRTVRRLLIDMAVKDVRASVNANLFIDHAVNNIDELDKTANILAKRLREWYELYLPEVSRGVQNHEAFVRLIIDKEKSELVKEFALQETMGADLAPEDIKEMLLLAKHLRDAYDLRGKHLMYLEATLKTCAPNMLELCGTSIAAKLIEKARGLRRLAMLPSSTVQLLGAEKALFRHLTRKTRPPKHGLIHEHPLIQHARRENRGKVARALADKISMCARLDYFKGEFKAGEYRKELEEKFK